MKVYSSIRSSGPCLSRGADETMAEDSEAGVPAVAEGAEKSLATDAPEDAPAAKRQKTDAEPGEAAAEEAAADDSAAAAAAAAVTAGADAGAAADEAAGSSEGKKSGKEKASKDDEEGGAGSLAIPKNAVKRIMKLEDDVKQVGDRAERDVPWTLGVCRSVRTKHDPSRAAAAVRPLGSLFTIASRPALRLSPLLFPTPGPSGGGPPRGQGDRAFPREIRARLPQVRRAAGPQAGQIQ